MECLSDICSYYHGGGDFVATFLVYGLASANKEINWGGNSTVCVFVCLYIANLFSFMITYF